MNTEQERAAFEAWVQREQPAGCVADMARGWQARAAMAATPAHAPLTDEQIDKTAKRVIPVAAYMGMFEYAAFSKEDADRTVRHFARAIEAAHGIGASEGAKE